MDRETKRLNLQRWMDANGYGATALAAAMGVSRGIIHKYTSKDSGREVGRSFRDRFAEHFGWELARELFDLSECADDTALTESEPAETVLEVA